MSFRPALRILLSMVIILIASLGGEHGSYHADVAPAAEVHTASVVRASDGRCSQTTQSHCHMPAIASERPKPTVGFQVRSAGLFVVDDLDRAGLKRSQDEKPPRLT